MPGTFYRIKLTSLLWSFLARSAFVSREHGETLSHHLSNLPCLTPCNVPFVQDVGLIGSIQPHCVTTSEQVLPDLGCDSSCGGREG